MGYKDLKAGDVRGGFRCVEKTDERLLINGRYCPVYLWACLGCESPVELPVCRAMFRVGCGCLIKGQNRSRPESKGYAISWDRETTAETPDEELERFIEDHPDGATLDEIGCELGLTRERVRQIESNALAKLGRALQRLRAAKELEEAA